MTVAVFILLAVACVAFGIARLHGIVYMGRTLGGWTSVHDDRVVMGERIRVLEVEGTYQSATYLDERWCDPVFPYHRLFDHLFEAWPQGEGPRTAAILGGGGYALPKHLVAHHQQIERIDVVELDPAIERLARRYFFLDRLEQAYGAEASGRLQLHQGDARSWLQGCGQTFDAILNDCFLALEPEASLMTVEAARLVHRRLNPGGLYLTNVVAALEGPGSGTLYTTLEALSTTFAHVWLYPCGANAPTIPENNVVIATDAPCTFTGAWAWPPQGEVSR